MQQLTSTINKIFVENDLENRNRGLRSGVHFLLGEPPMGFDQYHEPANELSQKTRTFARMIASLGEEAEAINWYAQRISVDKNKGAKAHCAKCADRRV
jgi:hypothetical protein